MDSEVWEPGSGPTRGRAHRAEREPNCWLHLRRPGFWPGEPVPWVQLCLARGPSLSFSFFFSKITGGYSVHKCCFQICSLQASIIVALGLATGRRFGWIFSLNWKWNTFGMRCTALHTSETASLKAQWPFKTPVRRPWLKSWLGWSPSPHLHF